LNSHFWKYVVSTAHSGLARSKLKLNIEIYSNVSSTVLGHTIGIELYKAMIWIHATVMPTEKVFVLDGNDNRSKVNIKTINISESKTTLEKS